MTIPASHPAPDEEPEGAVGPMTFEEYLEFEEASETRHEFVNGYAFPMNTTAMSGGTRRHSKIIGNVAGQLWLRTRGTTRGTTCEMHSQGFKLQTPGGDTYYPDVMVSCGPPPPGDALYLDDPCLAVEVLSPSTERTDYSEKLESYTEVPTLGAYLIIETTWRAVHRHWRDADGAWRRDVIAGAEGVVPLPCPAGGALTLGEIYEGVDLPPEPPSRPRLRRVREPAGAYEAYDGYDDGGGAEPGDA